MKKNEMYDVIIVGGGPAGLSAAIYMARAKYKTLVIEKEKFGGQITITSEVVNYPGVFKTSGIELTNDMKRQAEAFGAEFAIGEVTDMDLENDIKSLTTTIGELKSLGVILALGASPREVGFKGEREFKGHGVAYCATCDGEFFTDLPIFVIGGGFAAIEEGIFLTKYAKNVKMLVREGNFTAAKTVADQVESNEKIEVLFNTEIVSVEGDTALRKITYRNNKTDEIKTEEINSGFGVFVFAGYVPNTKFLKNIELNRSGYIVTDINKQTNIEGVYAVGDVTIKELRQVVTAVADGATAATAAEKYVSALHEKLDLPPFEMHVRRIDNNKDKDDSKGYEAFLSDEIIEGLKPVFDKFETKIIVKAVVDNSPLAKELETFIEELKQLDSRLLVIKEVSSDKEFTPYLEILKENSESTGIKFHLMPGGHEFNSFILSLYNAASSGQKISDENKERILNINRKINVKVLTTLNCTMCPEVVVAVNKIATINNNITTDIFDISHFPDLKTKYNVMSVPCIIIDDKQAIFGKKGIEEILNLVK